MMVVNLHLYDLWGHPVEPFDQDFESHLLVATRFYMGNLIVFVKRVLFEKIFPYLQEHGILEVLKGFET
jgi:hypothetical protein